MSTPPTRLIRSRDPTVSFAQQTDKTLHNPRFNAPPWRAERTWEAWSGPREVRHKNRRSPTFEGGRECGRYHHAAGLMMEVASGRLRVRFSVNELPSGQSDSRWALTQSEMTSPTRRKTSEASIPVKGPHHHKLPRLSFQTSQLEYHPASSHPQT